MSNRINLNAVKFEYLDGNVYYGYTISDDNEMTFDYSYIAMIVDDLELLRYVKVSDNDIIKAILDLAKEEEKGMLINGTWYDYDKLKETLED